MDNKENQLESPRNYDITIPTKVTDKLDVVKSLTEINSQLSYPTINENKAHHSKDGSQRLLSPGALVNTSAHSLAKIQINIQDEQGSLIGTNVGTTIMDCHSHPSLANSPRHYHKRSLDIKGASTTKTYARKGSIYGLIKKKSVVSERRISNISTLEINAIKGKFSDQVNALTSNKLIRKTSNINVNVQSIVHKDTEIMSRHCTITNLHRDNQTIRHQEEEELENDLENMDFKATRKKIQQLKYINWFKKRYRANTNLQYLYYPEELNRKNDQKRIFQNFDADVNKEIDIDEFLDMFIDNYIIDKYSDNNYVATESDKKYRKKVEKALVENFQKLYETVTETYKLHLVDFVRLALNQDAVIMFTDFMREVKNNKALVSDKRNLNFLPMSFDDMVEFLSYRSQRQSIQNEIKSKTSWIDKFEVCLKLFELQEDCRSEKLKLKVKNLRDQNNTKSPNLEPIGEKGDFMKPKSFTRIDTQDMSCMYGEQILQKFQNEKKFNYDSDNIENVLEDIEENLNQQLQNGKNVNLNKDYYSNNDLQISNFLFL